MKKILVGVAVLTVASVGVARASVQVTCSNKAKTINVTYNDSVHGSDQNAFSYSRNETGHAVNVVAVYSDVNVDSTVLGHVVSVRDASRSIPDQADAYVSLVLPQLNLTPSLAPITFDTQAIETIAKTTIGGTAGVVGAVQSSEYQTVTCSASMAGGK